MKKSPTKSPSKSLQNPNPNPKHPFSTLPVSPQTQKILSLHTTFHKTIQLPIQHIESLEHSRTPQRCLLHNTILTLYCELDRKTLCANCMYQEETHRKHRVVPLSRATAMVKEDLLGFEIKLEGNLKQCSAISRGLQEQIVKNQRYYPSIIEQLKKYYTNMILMLREKQKEQLAQIVEQHQKMKNQILYLDHEIKNITSLIYTKLKPSKKQQTQDFLLTRRSILQTLTKVSKIINNQMTTIFKDEEEYDGEIVDFGVWQDIYDMVRNRLVVVLPGISVSPRNRNKKGVVYDGTLSERMGSMGRVGVGKRMQDGGPRGGAYENLHNRTIPNFKKSQEKEKYEKARSTSNKKIKREVTFKLA